MYADDTSITYAGKDLNEIDDYLNKDLKSVITWLSSNKLTLNLTKTEFLIITSRQRRVYLSDNPSLTINNKKIFKFNFYDHPHLVHMIDKIFFCRRRFYH